MEHGHGHLSSLAIIRHLAINLAGRPGWPASGFEERPVRELATRPVREQASC